MQSKVPQARQLQLVDSAQSSQEQQITVVDAAAPEHHRNQATKRSLNISATDAAGDGNATTLLRTFSSAQSLEHKPILRHIPMAPMGLECTREPAKIQHERCGGGEQPQP